MSSISNLPRKLPLPVRSYEIAKKGEIPEVLSATLYRTLKSCWICDDERLMKWEVHLPYDQGYACPPIWQDEWRITGRDRGPLIANGLMLETQLDEARKRQAAFDAFVAKRTQEIIDERAATRRQAEEERIEHLSYEKWRSEWVSLTQVMDTESKAKLVFKLSTKGADLSKQLLVLAAWEDMEVREDIEKAVHVFGPHRLIDVLRTGRGWPPELLQFVDQFIYKRGFSQGIERLFPGHTEPHRE